MKLPKELQNKNKNKTYKKGAIGNLNKIKKTIFLQIKKILRY